MKNLIILGGGYGGIKILDRLLSSKELPDDLSITLIDRSAQQCFKTKFYALAAGSESDKNVRIDFPIHPKLNFIHSEITQIKLDENQVVITNGETVHFDYLVIGLGSEDKYQSVPGAKEFALSIQTVDSAIKTNKKLQSLPPGAVVSIVGAGLTGVELASELIESKRDIKLQIFDRGSYILSAFPEKLSVYVQNWFDNHGVEIINHANITRVAENTLYNHNELIHSDAIIWTAGIQPNQVVQELNVEKDSKGRILLTPYHQIPNYEHVYVVGDCASLPHAPSAQLAEGQAEQIAQVLLKELNSEPLTEALPPIKLKGMLGALGRKNGFGLVAEKFVTGRVARLLKSGVLWMYKYHRG
nr:NAD(P)/FAD-dependent oxidoreductase [uncultured Bacillus sp.]